MLFSTFCWHYEDISLYSINYSHTGHPKLWYSIPPEQKEAFERATRTKLHALFKNDPNLLLDIVTMVNPVYLMEQGIKVRKTLQQPGEFIITFPASYHAGFSTGFNVGEAVNFTSHTWLDYGPDCIDLYRKCKFKFCLTQQLAKKSLCFRSNG